MQQMSSMEMLMLCGGALLFGILLGAMRKKPRATKYGAGSNLVADKKPVGRRIFLGVVLICIVLYVIAFVVMMTHGKTA